MTENNLILNRLFTQNVFFDMIDTNDNTTYGAVIQRFVNDYENKDNGALISEVYRFMSKSYRNEYFYQNTLLNKLLLGKHSINTTTALTQIPISKSKADFILINGKAVVYEIKTELDTFERLDTQLRDYFKAFNHVCVVTSDSQYDRAASLLQNTPVGIYALTPQNTMSDWQDVQEQSKEAGYKQRFSAQYEDSTIIKSLIMQRNAKSLLEFWDKHGVNKADLLVINTDRDYLDLYENAFGTTVPRYALMPDESVFRRKVRHHKVLLDDKFEKQDPHLPAKRRTMKEYAECYLWSLGWNGVPFGNSSGTDEYPLSQSP